MKSKRMCFAYVFLCCIFSHHRHRHNHHLSRPDHPGELEAESPVDARFAELASGIR